MRCVTQEVSLHFARRLQTSARSARGVGCFRLTSVFVEGRFSRRLSRKEERKRGGGGEIKINDTIKTEPETGSSHGRLYVLPVSVQGQFPSGPFVPSGLVYSAEWVPAFSAARALAGGILLPRCCVRLGGRCDRMRYLVPSVRAETELLWS